MQAVEFPQQAPEAIARYRLADLARNGRPHAGDAAAGTRENEDDEIPAVMTPALCITEGVIRMTSDTPLFRQTLARHHGFSLAARPCPAAGLGAQLFAALGATAAQNGAAAGGRHAGTETMHLAALALFGLIGSQHLSFPPSSGVIVTALPLGQGGTLQYSIIP